MKHLKHELHLSEETLSLEELWPGSPVNQCAVCFQASSFAADALNFLGKLNSLSYIRFNVQGRASSVNLRLRQAFSVNETLF